MLKQVFVAALFITAIACNNSSETKIAPTTPDNAYANKAIIEQYYQHFNNHDWQKMADMYVDSPEMKDPAYGIKNVTMSKADIIKKYAELQGMIPDVHDSIVRMYNSGDNVIVEFESTGTAPDKSKFVLPICTVFEIKNGKITKDLTYYDNF